MPRKTVKAYRDVSCIGCYLYVVQNMHFIYVYDIDGPAANSKLAFGVP